MRRLYILLFLTSLIGSFDSSAQDIPLFSQKLTNAFIYNPAVAGLNVGSLTYSYRMSYSGIKNAPKNNFLSVHTPVAGHRIGIGLNYYQESVNFLSNNYASAAFAYHLRLSKASSLSLGVSGEYSFSKVKGQTNSDMDDPVYKNLSNSNNVDFSFGMLFNGKYLRAGVASNRIATTWINTDSSNSKTIFFSGFLQGEIPLRGGNDLLEPYVAYRKFSETAGFYDIGLYYTLNNKIMAGASMRKGSVGSLTAGYYLTPKLFVGFSHEMLFGDVRSQVGSTNELTLRFDFSQYDYKSSFSNSYKSSLAYRRKTMSSHNKGSRSPAQMHRSQKKLASFSPNKRYQNVKKLSVTPSSQRYKAKSNKYKPPRKRKGKR
jgi:type IX secretion system PorP/SprF family membrane protein